MDRAGLGLTGLGRGGQQITKCRETFAKAVETLIELASLQVSFLHSRRHDSAERLPAGY